jgi:hypothetical protein
MRTPFDPAAVVRQVQDPDARLIIAEIQAGETCQAEALRHFLLAGLRLLKKKLELLGDMKRNDPRSPWGDWLRDNLSRSRTTAERYVRFAESVTLKSGLRVTVGELQRLLGSPWEGLLGALGLTEGELRAIWETTRPTRGGTAAGQVGLDEEGEQQAGQDEGDQEEGEAQAEEGGQGEDLDTREADPTFEQQVRAAAERRRWQQELEAGQSEGDAEPEVDVEAPFRLGEHERAVAHGCGQALVAHRWGARVRRLTSKIGPDQDGRQVGRPVEVDLPPGLDPFAAVFAGVQVALAGAAAEAALENRVAPARWRDLVAAPRYSGDRERVAHHLATLDRFAPPWSGWDQDALADLAMSRLFDVFRNEVIRNALDALREELHERLGEMEGAEAHAVLSGAGLHARAGQAAASPGAEPDDGAAAGAGE